MLALTVANMNLSATAENRKCSSLRGVNRLLRVSESRKLNLHHCRCVCVQTRCSCAAASFRKNTPELRVVSLPVRSPDRKSRFSDGFWRSAAV